MERTSAFPEQVYPIREELLRNHSRDVGKAKVAAIVEEG
jgi:hypothetical protein